MGERIKLSDVKTDIYDAFNAAVTLAHGYSPDEEADVIDARERVTAFLAQCEADNRHLATYKAALEACVEVMDHGDGEAFTQALMALGRYTN